MPEERLIEYLDRIDAAASRPLITYGEWLAERRRNGHPGGMASTFIRECNWHGPNWLGLTCPACGAVVWERRDGRMDCHTCDVWWASRDELDEARRQMAARPELTE